MKKLVAWLFLMLFFAQTAMAEKEPIPEILRFTQNRMVREHVRENVYIQRTYPVTKNEAVNAEMRQVIDRLTEECRPYLPTGHVRRDKSYLRVNTGVSRTGQSWMSFLSLGVVKHEFEQTHVAFDARVYDLATGKKLTLDDLFEQNSEGWSVLEQAVRTQLCAYFPQRSCAAQDLDSLCSRESLSSTPFTLTAGSLRLHFRADELYPGQNTLMHVRVMYSDIRRHMKPEAQAQTDNSCYKLAALTFDDGPAHAASINVVDVLRRRGADATFFLVGNMMASGHYVMAYEHDAGFPLAYHSYTHITEGKGIAECIPDEWQKFREEIVEITGTIPGMMRAPGGYEDPFVRADIGIPLIHWSVSAGDGSAVRSYDAYNRRIIAGNVGIGAQDGAVILMHDLRPACYQYLELTLDHLEERGFLCVTVDELFDAYGEKLQPNMVYYGAESLLQ